MPPRDWRAGLAGDLLVATHLALWPEPEPPATMEDLRPAFGAASLNGSLVADGAAMVGSDFQMLSARVARAAHLLRTRVDVTLEQQNRDLLHSMDRQADL